MRCSLLSVGMGLGRGTPERRTGRKGAEATAPFSTRRLAGARGAGELGKEEPAGLDLVKI